MISTALISSLHCLPSFQALRSIQSNGRDNFCLRRDYGPVCIVFNSINKKGAVQCDTKKTLAVSIYNTLKALGVEVFLDEPELDLGDSIPSEIQHAIKTSFLHVAILSPRYAESTWCLEELSLMSKSGKTIIPVFYDVDVNDIRWIKGRYAQDFSMLEGKKRYRPEKIEDWKSALQNVSYLKGHIVNSDQDDKEVLMIIKKIILEHPKKTLFMVAEHPVGLDKTLFDFEISVMNSSQDVKIVGITGIGGCGKTTLAKEYYNKMIQSFYRGSFVCDVRDTPTKNLYIKQKKMFQDLGGPKDLSFDSVEEGKAILAEYLRFVQVFIILDNVDHQDQLESLLPTKDSFTHGSVIVVTSRDPGILISWGIPSNSIYKMKKLSPRHAMELFCWHSFQIPTPVEEFECLVKKYLTICKGLPLSIKVLGALVHGRCKEYWNGQLEKFSRSLHKDIRTVFVVSFDALDEEEKEIFLDISCFFIGIKKDSAIIVWEESGWSGAGSLGTLVDKCLVEVDEDKCLRMHDLLRDLGKDISMTRAPYRLWSPQQITYIENQGRESVPIRGIKAQTDEFYEEFVEFIREELGRGIKRRRGLKIVDVENNYFTEELAPISQGLISLRWTNFPHTSLPPWISLKKLRVLELCEASKLEEPWIDSDNPPVQLRVLKISHAESFQRFPKSIGFLKHLKEISFDGKGAPIEGLPDEFCSLQMLERLEFVECNELKSLPSKFGDLRNLQYLRLESCSAIDVLPEEFGHLQSLNYLSLSHCDNLKSLAGEFGALTNLEVLQLVRCSHLMIPSEVLMQLARLHDLEITCCPGPTEFVIQEGSSSSNISFSSLTNLYLNSCRVSRISISPNSCPTLQTLLINQNHDLVEISSLPVSVKSVEVMACSNLPSISLNSGLVKLESLDVWRCEELRIIKGIENCSSLETLALRTHGEVPVIEGLKDMESLRRVSLIAECHISALEPFLQSLNREKWPSRCQICVTADPSLEAIAKCFAFPGVTLVDSLDRQKIDMNEVDDSTDEDDELNDEDDELNDEDDCLEPFYYWEYVFSEELSANEAVMICLVINSDGDIDLTTNVDQMMLPEGKKLYVSVFFPSSLEEQEISSHVSFVLRRDLHSLEDDLLETGILVMGEENRVVDAFYELVQHLGKTKGICATA